MNRRWLAPLTPLYAAGVALRNRRFDNTQRLRWPVISIGNLSTGGAGKTPLSIALGKALSERGVRVDVLSRGYGRQSQLAAKVNPEGTAEEFGDEPLLIARATGLPVYVARQRYDAGLLAEADAADEPRVHLLDDGFQHRQLARDVDILLLNRNDLKDCLLPAGNLREPLCALQRATVVAIPADEPEVEQYLREIILIDKNSKAERWTGPIWKLRRTMELPKIAGPVAAFCGIAHPEQFFAGLEATGLRPVVRKDFPDHHRFTEADLSRLIATSRAAGAVAFITTEKDLLRLGKLSSVFPADLPLTVAHLTTEIEESSTAIDWLIERLNLKPMHSKA